ncbi:MAG: putative D-mannonate dehydrogenase [Ignavibacteriae bacterium]|nr:MAG: putative D-mannonate dehydrogenase [Ignavibacteriota bacterium]
MLIGKEIEHGILDLNQIYSICESAFSQVELKNKSVLVIIPDNTRHAPIDLFFKVIYDLIGNKVKSLDYLIATGTHQPMTEQEISKFIGVSQSDIETKYSGVRIFNHDHRREEDLIQIGTISAVEIEKITNGLLKEEIKVTINKMILGYDQIILVSPVVPHETVGFSGGNKYFFPGIGGLDIIQSFHWLGAVITNPVINGVKDTPVRRVIDRAAKFLPIPRLCLAFVVVDHGLACLYAGTPEQTWDKAADCSAKHHIIYMKKPYKKILGIASEIYTDLWVAGKVMYKLEPIVADDGELIIYAPHVKDISFVHEKAIREVGYHVRDYFLKQWDKFSKYSKLILAHSTNVRGIGKYENGVEYPRIKVTLATSIPEEVCEQINLAYQNPDSIDIEKLKKSQSDEFIVVENAGQILYRLENDVFRIN